MKTLRMLFYFFIGILAGCTDLTPGVEYFGGVAKINYIDNYYAGKYYIAEYYIGDTNRDWCSDGYCSWCSDGYCYRPPGRDINSYKSTLDCQY